MEKFSVPKDYKYSDRHEWVRKTSDGNYKIGLTPFALDLLGEIVYFELPQEGESFNSNDPIGIVEAVKAATDIFTPISGEIVKVNEDLLNNPKMIEESPYDEGWLLEFIPDDHTDKNFQDLLTAESYDLSVNN